MLVGQRQQRRRQRRLVGRIRRKEIEVSGAVAVDPLETGHEQQGRELAAEPSVGRRESRALETQPRALHQSRAAFERDGDHRLERGKALRGPQARAGARNKQQREQKAPAQDWGAAHRHLP